MIERGGTVGRYQSTMEKAQNYNLLCDLVGQLERMIDDKRAGPDDASKERAVQEHICRIESIVSGLRNGQLDQGHADNVTQRLLACLAKDAAGAVRATTVPVRLGVAPIPVDDDSSDDYSSDDEVEEVQQPPKAALPAPPEPGPGPGASRGDECSVCMVAQPNTVFLPCRHQACCSGCAARLASCPVCREPVKDLLHVFRV